MRDGSFEDHVVPPESVLLRPALPGWTAPVPGNGAYGLTNIIKRHGNNSLYLTAEPDEVYAFHHTRFNTIPPGQLISANVSMDIMIGRDYSFDPDMFFAVLANGAFPDCPGRTEDCYVLIGEAQDLQWNRIQRDVRHAVTRTDWSGFFLMLLMTENHYSDFSMGFVDRVEFNICTRGGRLVEQPARSIEYGDLQTLLDALPGSHEEGR